MVSHMSKNKAKHTPRKPRPSELAAKAAREASKRQIEHGEALHSIPAKPPGKPGRKPQESKAFTKTTMVRMFESDYEAFHAEAQKLAEMSGAAISVGAYLRMAGRAMLGRKLAQ